LHSKLTQQIQQPVCHLHHIVPCFTIIGLRPPHPWATGESLMTVQKKSVGHWANCVIQTNLTASAAGVELAQESTEGDYEKP